MLKVFVIEDDREQRERLVNYIKEVVVNESLNMEVALSTDNMKELVCNIEEKENTGVYFIDVDLGDDLHGIELAEIVRKYDPNGFIIFVTTHGELSYLTFKYKVEALDYISKDNIEEEEKRVRECLIEANRRQYGREREKGDVISIKNGDKILALIKSEIMFFETSMTAHKIILHATNRQIEFYGSIKDIEERCDDDFFRSHKSILLNVGNIVEVDRNHRYVVMKNGEKCITGVRQLKKLMKMLQIEEK